MPIVQQGAINTTALVVPDLYVQIVPPQNLMLNGVPTNVVGVVGTATWGPVGQPAIVATMADYARTFGAIQPRKYDMGTAVAIAVQQGAQNFRCVRASDGTDTAATAVMNGTLTTDNSAQFTALYTGSLGNSVQITLGKGSKAASYKVTIALPGLPPEVFDNITGAGAAFWTALVAAVNGGTGPTRGASQLVSAAAGAGANAAIDPSTLTLPMTSTLGSSLNGGTTGTDGTTTITAATLIGQDMISRKGMYALRSLGCGIGLLADADDSTQWTTQAAFGLQEGIYMMLVAPAGSAIQNGTTGTVDLKTTAGLDSYAVKLLHGDWLYWNDQINGAVRLVSPQGFAAGRLANLSPEQSSLNKQIYGIIGSQKSGQAVSGQGGTYSAADLAVLLGNGIDVISKPQPGGTYWGVRGGHNSSSNPATNGDIYTRLTNYIAATLAAGMGIYVGQVINADLFRRVRATQLSFLQNMLGQGMLGSTDGSLPFSVICDPSNNPQSRTALGYVQSDAQVQYQAINEKFIVNIEGGQTVQVSRQTVPTGQPAA